ncbi:MAG: hypothetical protein UT63_C0097G0003 [Candidatus Gottesmanbacteria bacterium GW2011_GWC2_39_8]|uniref:Uncharacterized protein n=1 Tax=Candidatus Gottesmanbacteria bacterium GW2011_GWC2_39_8 TaxID=1618450 RepID=A0A0G0SY08_9BACT|nr:MAG: hypothetical protein UT63_C0097G0003 [Candidatus Gottesmanbacteria bacterium GW2011_GWC2_39_8]
MAKVLGFSFGSNEIQTVCLSGTKASPIYENRKRILLPESIELREVSAWAETQLGLLLDEFQPEALSYKLTRGANSVKEISRVYFTIGILNLIATRRRLAINHHNSPLSPRRLGLSRGADIRSHITSLIGDHPPYWDNHAKDAAIVAFLGLA